jgi:hypothetical protein
VRGNEIAIILRERRKPGDVPDRSQRRRADLADALGKVVDGRKNLLGLLVEQQMIVAKMRPADVPMKVLRLHEKHEAIGHKGI